MILGYGCNDGVGTHNGLEVFLQQSPDPLDTNDRVVLNLNSLAKLGLEDTMLKVDGWNTGLNGTKTVGCVTSCIDPCCTLLMVKDSDVQNPSTECRFRVGDWSLLSRESVVQGAVGMVKAINEASE